MDADKIISEFKKAIEQFDIHKSSYMDEYNGTKEKPYPVFVSEFIYNAFVEKGIVEEGDLVFSTYYGWCKLIYPKPLPEGKYIFNDNGTITHITENVNATQKKNKESMDKFLKGKFKERRY